MADDVARWTESIEGWLSEDEGRTLFEAARRTTGRGAIVEIGSWKGKSTIWLAAGARAAGVKPIYAVDPHRGSLENPAADTLADFLANLERAGARDMVVPVVMSSDQAAATMDEPIELLFIDGDHRFESTARDASLWLPRLVEGGTVIFHDVATSAWEGPRQIFRHTVCSSRKFGDLRLVGTMGCARHMEERPWGDRLRGAYISALLGLFDLRNRVKLPVPVRFAAKVLLRWTPLAATLPK